MTYAYLADSLDLLRPKKGAVTSWRQRREGWFRIIFIQTRSPPAASPTGTTTLSLPVPVAYHPPFLAAPSSSASAPASSSSSSLHPAPGRARARPQVRPRGPSPSHPVHAQRHALRTRPPAPPRVPSVPRPRPNANASHSRPSLHALTRDAAALCCTHPLPLASLPPPACRLLRAGSLASYLPALPALLPSSPPAAAHTLVLGPERLPFPPAPVLALPPSFPPSPSAPPCLHLSPSAFRPSQTSRLLPLSVITWESCFLFYSPLCSCPLKPRPSSPPPMTLNPPPRPSTSPCTLPCTQKTKTCRIQPRHQPRNRWLSAPRPSSRVPTPPTGSASASSPRNPSSVPSPPYRARTSPRSMSGLRPPSNAPTR